jgi:hypothetical protein
LPSLTYAGVNESDIRTTKTLPEPVGGDEVLALTLAFAKAGLGHYFDALLLLTRGLYIKLVDKYTVA